MDWIERYEALLQKQQTNYIRIGNLLLREYNQIIIPMGPILSNASNEIINPKTVFAKLNGKLLWWSYPTEFVENDGWYGIIKDIHIDIEQYKDSNLRRNLRKGFTLYDVKLISLKYLAENGEEIYTAVEKQYGNRVDKYKYKNQFLSYDGFEDIINCWGVFFEQKLVGYCLVLLYGKQEANISETKILSDYKKHSSFALFQTLSEHYLKNEGFDLISDGYRNMLHNTTIQEFLIKNFGFRKASLHLELAIRFPWNVGMRCLYPFRKKIRFSSVAAVLNLLAIYKNQKRLPK